MEIGPTYVDVAVMPWQKATGKTTTLENDGHSFDEISLERTADEDSVDAA